MYSESMYKAMETFYQKVNITHSLCFQEKSRNYRGKLYGFKEVL